MKRPAYIKDYSFIGISGVEDDTNDALKRIHNLSNQLIQQDLNDHEKSVIQQACRDLTSYKPTKKNGFWLRPHVLEELRRITDDELPRYLFYRYRYDVYPEERLLDAFPPCVQIEPTSVCNYRCIFCYQTDQAFTHKPNGHMGHMSFETFKRIIDEVEGKVEAVTLASRGEPLLCKSFVQMMDYVSDKFLGLKINTNAWHLNEKNAHAILSANPNTVVFSVDAADAKLYEKMRVNGQFDRVYENIRRFSEIRARHYSDSRTITRISGVRFDEDQSQEKMEAFWDGLVDQVAFVTYNPWENSYETPANKLSHPCSDLWRRTFIWWDGLVNPCDVDYRSTLAAGNINENSLSEIWQNNAYTNLRQAHNNGERQSLTPCKGCVFQ